MEQINHGLKKFLLVCAYRSIGLSFNACSELGVNADGAKEEALRDACVIAGGSLIHNVIVAGGSEFGTTEISRSGGTFILDSDGGRGDPNSENDDCVAGNQESSGGGTACSNANGKMSEMDLSRYIFAGAQFQGADLSGTNLTNADLSDADLSNANLSGANLSNTNLNGADLANANMEGVVY